MNAMNSNPDEARRSLQEVDEAADRVRRIAEYAGTDITLVAWGIVWVLGYFGNEIIPRLILSNAPRFTPMIAHIIGTWWAVLVICGIVCTFVAHKRCNAVESASGKRIGILWGALFGYAYVFGFLIMPFVEIHGSQELIRFYKHIGAIAAILPMFGYVVMGLWYDWFLTWIGLAVTALTIVGLILLYPWFYIWMAIVGGGALISAGLFANRKWRST